MYQEIEVKHLMDHPLNRSFERSGQEWEEFVESVREAGRVWSPLLVRPLAEGGYQVLAGHRRKAAAEACGLERVGCLVHELGDLEALELLLSENLQRCDLTVADEVRFVRELSESYGLSEESIARKVSRRVEWVRTRQGLLDLGDEVLAAVVRSEERLSLAAVDEILKVPKEWRDEAVQMVLHPELDLGPLSAKQAKEDLQRYLIEPKQAEQEWEAGRAELAKAWKANLKGEFGRERCEGLVVVAVSWEECQRLEVGRRFAREHVGEQELSDDAPEGLRWLDLAIRHGLPVKIIHRGGDETEALVDVPLLRQAEQAFRDGGETSWLRPLGKERKVEMPTQESEGDGFELRIEQKMEWSAMVDLGQVERVIVWLRSPAHERPKAEGLPQWSSDLEDEVLSRFVIRILEWVLSLKVGG